MNKKLFLFAVTMLASVTMFAQNWEKPVPTDYQFVTEMKNSLQANTPYWEGDTTVYYLYNIDGQGFLTNNTCVGHAQWATHAALKPETGNAIMMAEYRLAPVFTTDTTFVDSIAEKEDGTTEVIRKIVKIDTVKVDITPWDGVTYKLMDLYNGSWRGVFPTSSYAMFVDRASQADYMWNVKSMGNGVYRISVSDLNPTWNSHAADSLFGNPETYLGFNKIDPDYDPTAENVVMPLTPMLSVTGRAYNPSGKNDAGEPQMIEESENAIDWKFMAESEYLKYRSHVKAWNYIAEGKLEEYIMSVTDKYDKHISVAKLTAFLDATAPVSYDDIEAAIEETEAAIRNYLIATLFDGASGDNPVDVTILLANPDFEIGNTSGWTLNYKNSAPNQTVTNLGYQGASYTNGDVSINKFIEAWANSNFGGDPAGKRTLGDGSVYQLVKGLPAGQYSFSCDAIASRQDEAGQKLEKGAYLYAKSGDHIFRTAFSTNSGAPEHFEIKFVSVGGDIEFGFMTKSTTANWLAADNFTLQYMGEVGPADPFEVILKATIAELEKKYPDVDGLMANQEIKDAFLEELENARNCIENFQQEDSILNASAAELDASLSDYKRMEIYMEEVNAKSQAFLDSDFPGLGEELGDYYGFTLLEAYNYCTADAAMIDTIQSHMGRIIVDYITANVKPGDELTPLITNAAFDNNASGWSFTGARPGFGGKGDLGENEVGEVKTLNSGLAEVWHATFNMYQIIRNMPKGSFKLTAQALDRNDGGFYNYYQEGPEAGIHGILYANDFEHKIPSIMAGAQNEFVFRANDSDGYPSDTHVTESDQYVPNSREGANFYFNLSPDMYKVEVNFTLTEAGDSITIGLKNLTSTNSWVIFDNFRLFYNGSGVEAYKDAIESLVARLDKVFDNASYISTPATDKVNAAKEALTTAINGTDGDACIEAIAEAEAALAYAKKSIEDYLSLETIYSELAEALDANSETATPGAITTATQLLTEIENVLNTSPVSSTNEDVEALIKRAQDAMTAVKLPDYTGASAETPVDFSSVIVNGTFDVIDDFNGWAGSGFGAGGDKSTNAERYNMGFDTYQDIKGLIPGYYVAYVQAYYRHGNSASDYAKFTGAETSTKETYFYVTTPTETLQTEIQYASAAAQPTGTEWVSGGTATVGNGLIIPNMMTAATSWFGQIDENSTNAYTKAKYYNHFIQFQLTESGNIRIGVKKDGNVGADWALFDNFKLFYIGSNPDENLGSAIESVVTDKVAESVKGIYNLNGQKLSAPVKGLNIINGQKVLVK